MKFTDIIDLAKAGYSPKDIKDLLALEPNSHEQDPGPEEKPAPDPLPDDKDKIIEDLKKQIAENESKLKESEGKPDEEVKPDPRDAEIEELKKKIAAFQAAETKKDISGNAQKTDDEILQETVRKFM